MIDTGFTSRAMSEFSAPMKKQQKGAKGKKSEMGLKQIKALTNIKLPETEGTFHCSESY